MRTALFFAFALLVTFASAQDIDRFNIDDFSLGIGTNNVALLIGTSIDVAAVRGNGVTKDDSESYGAGCQGLIGCERDLRIEVFKGESGRTFNADIFKSSFGGFIGEYTIATPKGGNAQYYIQYDGIDGTFDLNTSGLPSGDRNFNGRGETGVRFYAVSDLNTTYTIEFFSPNGGVCRGTVIFPVLNRQQAYTRDDILRDLPYRQMTGNCDFANVGAVQLTIPSLDAVDAIIRDINAFGPPDPSPSPTPAPSASSTPVPSQSRTPAPSASSTPAPSQSPSQTPSPSGPCIRRCTCPKFTCAIIYDGQFSRNDIDFGFTTGQLVLDDSDSITTNIVYVTRSSVSVPTVSVPTVSIPTVSVPTVSIPTVSIPTVSVPTVSNGSNGNSGGDNGNSGGDNGNSGGDNGNSGGDNGNSGADNGNQDSNSSVSVAISATLVLVALLF